MWPSWRTATGQALYSDSGFYRRARVRPYRTSVEASGRFAVGIAAVLRAVDGALGHPTPLDLVDVGAGSGRLLRDVAAACDADVQTRLRLTAVELGPPPDGLGGDITWDIAWRTEPPAGVTGLVVANEWLDNVPVDVVEQTADGPRLVHVDPATGAERLGGSPEPADLAWLRRWWPLGEPGWRAEPGGPRDRAWAGVLNRMHRGVAIAADYGHRLPDRPPFGTLTGYRDGRQVPPVPDGSCDVTAHVALDACAAAGQAAGATATVLTTQREALRALGIRAGRPPVEMAGTDPAGYLTGLRRAGEEAELLDPAGLGGFGWLVQAVGGCLPAALAATMDR